MNIKCSQREWVIGAVLASGGFAKVFEASPDGGGDAAVAKFVPKQDGAGRELLFGESGGELRNVVPVIDTGETADHWVLVMPRAEHSLADLIKQQNGELLPLDETFQILVDVADALVSMQNEVVHRDIKPDNVLLLDGKWSIADFGISRYADAATASDTRKHALTPAYASPEQWRGERATSAADVYAFGVMAYELLAGVPPFAGPEHHDFRQQHLTATPPRLTGGPARLRSLVEECLLKSPEARPRPSNISARLSKAQEFSGSGALAELARVNQAVTQRRATEEATQASQKLEIERRARIAADGARIFSVFVDPLIDALENDAPSATIERGAGHGVMEFVARWEGAQFGVKSPSAASSWGGPFSVLSTATITVRYENARMSQWQGRSHSLWYCDAYEKDVFRWYELAFMRMPLIGDRRSPDLEPYAQDPNSAEQHFMKVMGVDQLAWPVEELDRDDPTPFVERWLKWFAAAATGSLRKPSLMPERPDNRRWRS